MSIDSVIESLTKYPFEPTIAGWDEKRRHLNNKLFRSVLKIYRRVNAEVKIMKKIYVVRHQKLGGFPNPKHTEEGLEKLREVQLPAGIEMVVVGTGGSFLEMLDVFRDRLIGVPIKYSPFCGQHNYNPDKKYVLSNGTEVSPENYIGIKCSEVIDVRRLIMALAKQAESGVILILAGGELITALKVAVAASSGNQKGVLLEVDTDSWTATILQ